MAIYAGIDGGGTKTICAVGNETRVLGIGVAAGSNVVRSGEAQAGESLQSALKQACTAGAVTPSEISRVCVGASGAGRPEQKDLLRRALAKVVSGEIAVVGDMETTMFAAFEDGPGVIAIAGTGSIVYGRNRQGKTARAGGWGYAISDEGSGQWIGRKAVAAAFRARDEDHHTLLMQLIKNHWRLQDADAIVRVANGSPAPDFSELVPLVVRAADEGDEIANDVLTRAAKELVAISRIVVEGLFPGDETVRLAMSGGVFRECAVVRDAFTRELRAIVPGVELNEKVVEPVDGALAMARRGTCVAGRHE